MMQKRRYHPLTMLFDLWGYVKGAFIPALFLFVLNYDSETFIMKYGRYAFIIITVLAVIFFVLKWLTYRYELREDAFHLYSGYIDKEEQIVPYSKIQNMNRRTSALHRLFGMTSLHFETAMSGENATVVFEAITKQQAETMESITARASSTHEENTEEFNVSNEETGSAVQPKTDQERIIHFTPTTKDTIRASFTSLSFLVLIPVLITIYVKANDVFNIEAKTEGMVTAILSSWWIIAIVTLSALLISIGIGIGRIYLKYGKYEISSDKKQIYITQGVLNETSFSVAKQNIQAIEIEQSLMKRMLDIVEIKLISAGRLDLDDDDLEISSLYPFLKSERAYAILKDILPTYEIEEQMTSLPRTSLWIELLRGCLLYLIPAAILVYFKPTIWGISEAWWLIILLLFILVNTGILLSYRNSAYTMNNEFIQFKTGGFGTSMFITKREKVIEMKVSRSFLQQKLGLATLEIVNRAHPVKHTDMTDVPLETAGIFYHWYRNRTKDIEVEQQ